MVQPEFNVNYVYNIAIENGDIQVYNQYLSIIRNY